MTLPVISVIIPTVDGREDHLRTGTSAYVRHAPGNYELDLIVKSNYPTCGHGWQAGLSSVRGQYVHFTCDDIEPREGWAAPAIEAIEAGFLPAPQVWGPRGEPQSHPGWLQGRACVDWEPVYMTSLPFVSLEQLEKIVPLFTSHYCSDDWFGYRAGRAGWGIRVRTGYTFTHHWAQHKRGAGMGEGARLQYDSVLFAQAQRMVEAGEWNEPWPPVEVARPNG